MSHLVLGWDHLKKKTYMAKAVTKKAAPKKKAEPKKIGHMNMTLFNDESVTVDVDCLNQQLISALASIIASDNQAGRLIRTALAVVAASDFFEDEKPKKKKAAPKKKAPAVKKAAPKKKK
jgi:hypothetical protein